MPDAIHPFHPSPAAPARPCHPVGEGGAACVAATAGWRRLGDRMAGMPAPKSLPRGEGHNATTSAKRGPQPQGTSDGAPPSRWDRPTPNHSPSSTPPDPRRASHPGRAGGSQVAGVLGSASGSAGVCCQQAPRRAGRAGQPVGMARPPDTQPQILRKPELISCSCASSTTRALAGPHVVGPVPSSSSSVLVCTPFLFAVVVWLTKPRARDPGRQHASLLGFCGLWKGHVKTAQRLLASHQSSILTHAELPTCATTPSLPLPVPAVSRYDSRDRAT